jgi:putative DNA primase/helicase
MTIIYDPNDMREIVERTLTAGGMSVWYGEPNSGKTTLLLDLALRMPSGRPWLGRRVPRAAVIWIACEGAWVNPPPARCAPQTPQMRHRAIRHLISCALNLMDPSADVEELIDLVLSFINELVEPVALIVVDTAARAMPGANETPAKTWADWLPVAIESVRRPGRTSPSCTTAGKDAAKGARAGILRCAAPSIPRSK